MAVVELTPLGPCPTCGAPRWDVATCRCGHSVSIHDFGKRGGKTVRTACSRQTADGKCPCVLFEVA